MYMFRKLTDDEKIKYKKILDRAEAAFGIEREDGLLINKDDKDIILFVCGSLFMLFSLENNEIKLDSFIVDSDYKVVSATKDDKQYIINDNSLYLIEENGRHYSLSYVNKRNNSESNSNSMIEYMQYNSKQDLIILLRYDCFGSLGTQIYPYHLNSPFCICIENKVSKRFKGLKFLGSKKAYYRLAFNKEKRLRYLLASSKDDTGTVEGDNTSSLVDDKEFFRYYRVLLQLGEYVTITGFPFSRQYKIEDLENILKQVGFDTLKQQELVSIYNNKDEIKGEYQLIADEFRKNNFVGDNKALLMIKNIS